MLRIREIKININECTLDNIRKKCAKKLNVNESKIKNIKINKESIDARNKNNICYVYEVDIEIENESKYLNKSIDVMKVPDEKYRFNITGNTKLNERIVIVGAGPAGLLCAYILATNNYPVTLIERGEKVEDRIKSVEEFWNNENLNINSNVQFGEGGAGTFSDGKLNTLVKDKLFRQKKVFEIFVECGAPEEIMYENKPHIGTDKLRIMVKKLRNKIIDHGGIIRYNTCLTDIKANENKLEGIEVNNSEFIKTDVLVLAIGHSARDTFKMLYQHRINMTPKPFAVGIRIMHPQDMIDKSQYGNSKLKKASYKLTYQTKEKRGVYTFCMCPGGYVVNASSEKNRLAINGMSNYERESKNANSAVIVTVTPSDFGEDPMDGIKFQRELEEKAYNLGNGKIPIQLYGDFKNNLKTNKLGDVEPIFKGNYTFSNLNDILPKYISDSLKEGIDYFGKKIKGYDRNDAIIAAIESRTSSPVRIVRDDLLESNIKGIYPCGEGAGYAGGITSAAVDGIKIAEAIASFYSNK